MKYLIIGLIQIYKRVLYPIVKPFFPSSCRFTPSCSLYTMQSIEKYGIIKGTYLGFLRILRCNNWFN